MTKTIAIMPTLRHIRPSRERPPEALIEAEGCKIHIIEGRIDNETGARFTTVEVIAGRGWENESRRVDNIVVSRIVKSRP